MFVAVFIFFLPGTKAADLGVQRRAGASGQLRTRQIARCAKLTTSINTAWSIPRNTNMQKATNSIEPNGRPAGA